MNRWRRPLILLLALLASGGLRMPFEAALTRDLQSAGLLSVPMDIGTRDKIGQTSAAVALGGLRTLVATFLHLRAHTFFTELRWDDVAETFHTIVDLAPRTPFYWETGAWHQAYNAAAFYLNDSKLPPLRRKTEWRAAVLRGRAFLERGIRNNPDSPGLHTYLGYLLTDKYKSGAFKDGDGTFSAAADAYQAAADSGKALPYVRRFQLYALARVPSREAEALALARTLYQTSSNRTPTLQAVFFALECHANPSIIDPLRLALSIFESEENAYHNLSNYWLRAKERLPVHGLASVLTSLETTLGIPAQQSIFLQRPVQDTEDE